MRVQEAIKFIATDRLPTVSRPAQTGATHGAVACRCETRQLGGKQAVNLVAQVRRVALRGFAASSRQLAVEAAPQPTGFDQIKNEVVAQWRVGRKSEKVRLVHVNDQRRTRQTHAEGRLGFAWREGLAPCVCPSRPCRSCDGAASPERLVAQVFCTSG